MAKFIKNIVDRVNLATKKGLAGYWTPEQIANEVHSESMNIWKKYVDFFEKTNKLDLYMRPFQNSEDVALVTGSGTIVTKDFIYYIEDKDSGIEIHQVDNKKWGTRKSHPIKVATATYPICNITNQAIEVLPSSIVNLKVAFLKKPTKPVWAYDVVGSRYVYNDTNSVDFEWNEILHDDIMNRVLGNLGIPIRDFQLVNQSERDKAQEGK